MCADLNLQKRSVIKMAKTEQTMTSCVSNYSGHWFNNCLARINVKGHITSESHMHFFCIHKTKWKATKWKVSKEEVTQSHECCELHVRNNFTTQKVYIKQSNSVRQSTKQVTRVQPVQNVSWPWLHYYEACQKQADFT